MKKEKQATIAKKRSMGMGLSWSKNSTKTHQNRKLKLYHVFTHHFLLENRTFYKLSTTFGFRRVFTPRMIYLRSRERNDSSQSGCESDSRGRSQFSCCEFWRHEFNSRFEFECRQCRLKEIIALERFRICFRGQKQRKYG